MYLTIKQQVKQLSKEDYLNLKELSHIAKNLANEAIYNVRQYYFNKRKFLKYEKNYALLKTSENYKQLNSNMAQQILKEVDGMFQSFFGLIRFAKQGKYSFRDIKLPKYLPKDGFTTLVIGFVRLNKNTLKIPYSYRYKKEHKPITINIPPKLIDKKMKEIRIIPKQNARFFEIQYIYEEIEGQSNLNKNHALAIDFFQQNSNIGKKNNQIFTNLPFGKPREKLEYLCQLYGIEFIEKEESYTSKASFFDKDDMPMYNDDNPKEYTFSGKRVKRGLYQCANGRVVNADVNRALNILNKSRVVDLEVLYSRGEVDTPIRIRIV